VKLRAGRKNPHNLYLQRGDMPADDDPCLGLIIDPEDTVLLCDGLTSPWHLNEMRINHEDVAD
jgi:hypothetical protein